MTASALGFSGMSVFVKRLSPEIPQFELVFFRSAVNLVWVAALMKLGHQRFWAVTDRPILVFRGLVGFAGVACMFYSLSNLPLPISSFLTWCSPLFVILLSRLVLKERMPPLSGLFIPIAFAGLLLLIDPFEEAGGVYGSLIPALVGLLAAFFGGTAYVAVRALTSRVGANVIVLYFTAVSTLASAPLAAAHFVSPGLGQWVELICLGSLATVGPQAMTRAYRYAPAGVVSMMSLLNPVLGAAFGLSLFGESLVVFQWIGMVLVGVALAGLATQSTRSRAAASMHRG